MLELTFHPVSEPPPLNSFVLAKTSTFPGYQVLHYKTADRDQLDRVGATPIYDDPHFEPCETNETADVLEWAYLSEGCQRLGLARADPMSQVPCCRIDDLVAALQRLRTTHGNTRVCLHDPDTDMELPVGVCVRASGYGDAPLIMIHADYNFTPRGYVPPVPAVPSSGPDLELDETRIYDGAVIAVDPGDSRCCHRRCPSLRVDPDVGTCDRYASVVVKAAGGPVNAGAHEDVWFRCSGCLHAFGG